MAQHTCTLDVEADQAPVCTSEVHWGRLAMELQLHTSLVASPVNCLHLQAALHCHHDPVLAMTGIAQHVC